MKRLTMLAGLDAVGGYGRTAIAFSRGIESLTGARVQIRASSISERFGATIHDDIRERIVHGPQADPWELLIHPPNFVPTPGKKTAFFTMNESTRLQPLSVHLLNKAAVVIVPSQFCAVTFSACGVNVPIRVVPLGIDPKIFHWREFPAGDNVVFGTAGSLAGGEDRKGIGEVVSAFRKAFQDEKNVRLKIKCHPDRNIEDWMTDDERIEVLPAHLSDAELADWYASLTCFVSASKCEGFGLMQLEAMAIGRPLLSHAFGGVSDFCPTVYFRVPHQLISASPPYLGHWAHVTEPDLIHEMQFVHNLPSIMPEIGNQQHGSARCWTWKRATEKLISVLNEFGVLTDAPQEFHSL